MRFFILFLVFSSLLSAAPAFAEDAAVPTREVFSQEHRHEIYDAKKKSHTAAAVYSFVFPGFGNFYAEQYFLGGVNAMVGIFGLTFLTYGLVSDQSEFLWLSAGFLTISYLEGLAFALYGVSDYNTELRRGLRINEKRTHVGSAPGFAVAIRF